jgi:hypothetical protein
MLKELLCMFITITMNCVRSAGKDCLNKLTQYSPQTTEEKQVNCRESRYILRSYFFRVLRLRSCGVTPCSCVDRYKYFGGRLFLWVQYCSPSRFLIYLCLAPKCSMTVKDNDKLQ